MAGEDDDINHAKRRIDELRKIRSMRPWSEQSFKDELLDFVGEMPSDKNTSLRNVLRCRMAEYKDFIGRAVFRLVYGYPQAPLDEEAKDILDSLMRDGKINKYEWDRAVWQRVLRRSDDGVLESIGPRPYAFKVAKVGFAVLVVAGSLGVVKMLEDPFYLPTVLPLAVAGGLAVGLVGKMLYYFAWGHRDLAKRLRYFCPHRNLRLNIYDK